MAAPLALLAARCNADMARRMSVGMAWIAAIAALTAGWMYGVPRLQTFAAEARFVSDVHVRFMAAPPWFRGELADHVMRIAESHLQGNPLRRDDLVAVRDALLETGWFEEIHQVRRVADDLVEIDARFARPWAVVRDERGDHLVDVAGRLLAMRYERGARTNFIAITGVRFERPQRAGERWEGADIAAAMRLLAVVELQPWRNQVIAIDVSGHLDGRPMRLTTDKGSCIVWGSPPGEEPGLEVLAEGKLKRLDFMYRTYGRIDAGEHNREIDLTDPRYVASRERLSQSTP